MIQSRLEYLQNHYRGTTYALHELITDIQITYNKNEHLLCLFQNISKIDSNITAKFSGNFHRKITKMVQTLGIRDGLNLFNKYTEQLHRRFGYNINMYNIPAIYA